MRYFTVEKLKIWLAAIRPKTLWAAVVPVGLGAAMAFDKGSKSYLIFFAILITAVLIQILTNLVNDLIDARKGTDNENRVGPVRAVHTGLLNEQEISKGIFLITYIILVFGLLLVFIGGWPILLIGSSAIACAYWYSYGSFALSYTGLADAFVFIFFGPVAVAGTFYLLTGFWNIESAILGCAPGFISIAILCANNLRDYETDKLANKKTLIVRFGRNYGKVEYTVALLLAFIAPMLLSVDYRFSTLLAALGLLPALSLIFKIAKASEATNFLPFLPETARLLPVYLLLFVAGLFL